MTERMIKIETTTQIDLNNINRVIQASIMKWNLPERVKRLSLPSYFYNEEDLKHLEIVVAKQANNIIGIASWEQADSKDTPEHQSGLLLHGLYVHPDIQNQGVGKKLLQAAENAGRTKSAAGLLVKAQKDAIPFFLCQNFKAINIDTSENRYANLLWCSLET